MAQAPQRITIKRRRHEEPVDALYIPTKKSRPSTIWKRITDDGSDGLSLRPEISAAKHRISSESQLHRSHRNLPTVSSLLGISDSKNPKAQPNASNRQAEPLATWDLKAIFASAEQTLGSSSRKDTAKEPRKFFLGSTSTKDEPSRPSTPSKGIKKRKSPQKGQKFALLVGEDAASQHQLKRSRSHQLLQDAVERSISTSSLAATSQATQDKSSEASPRKRPNINAAEKARKVATSQREPSAASSDAPSKPRRTSAQQEWDVDSDDLAAKLNAIALEEIERSAKQAPPPPSAQTPAVRTSTATTTTAPAPDQKPTQAASQLKYQPRSPTAARRHDSARQASYSTAERRQRVDDPSSSESEYVFDTFIIDDVDTATTATSPGGDVSAPDPSRMGILLLAPGTSLEDDEVASATTSTMMAYEIHHGSGSGEVASDYVFGDDGQVVLLEHDVNGGGSAWLRAEGNDYDDDDDDENAEGYYANEYPSDEDADALGYQEVESD